jgi:hypothetical protein
MAARDFQGFCDDDEFVNQVSVKSLKPVLEKQ